MSQIHLFGFRLPASLQRTRVMPVIIAFTLALFVSPVVAGDWQVLFDGKNLDGWKPLGDDNPFELVDGTILASSSNKTCFLHVVKEYGDFELELEVKFHDEDVNSGVQIRTSTTRTNNKGELRPSIHGPQVDLGRSPGRSGFLFGQGGLGGWMTPKEDLNSHSHMINGEWNKVRVLAVGPRIQTWINDEPLSDLVAEELYEKYPKGVIALQVHGVKKSPEKIRHVSFRSIRVRELDNY